MQDNNNKSKYTPLIILGIVELIMLIPWGVGYNIFPHGRGGIDTIVFAPFHSYPILVVFGIIVAKIKLDKGQENFAVMISLFPLFILMAWIPLMFVLLHVAGSTYFYVERKISNLSDDISKTIKQEIIAKQEKQIIEIRDVSLSERGNGSCYLPYKVYKKDGAWKVDRNVGHPAGFGKSVNYNPECIEKQIEMEKLYIEHIAGKKK